MSNLTRNQIETGVLVGSYTTSLVAGAIEGVIKHRAIFKKDGISEKEKSIGRKATYTRWVASTISCITTCVMTNRIMKEMSTASEEIISHIEKEVE